jgi:hypothetical protein
LTNKNGHKIKGAKKPFLQLSTALACYNWNIDCDNQYLHYSIGPSIGLLLDYWLLALQYTGTLHCTALGKYSDTRKFSILTRWYNGILV